LKRCFTVCLLALLSSTCSTAEPGKPVNFLLITADDLEWSSVGAYGSRVENITPNIGAPGFQPIANDVPLLQESLKSAGYLNGSIGKTRHLQPTERFGWDLGPDADNPGEGIWMHHLGNGRDIGLYKNYMTEFLQLARKEEQPFWLMLNTHDPHKPFYGDGGDEFDYPVSRVYSPEEIEVPGFLPDLPDVCGELARYYTSVRRADDIVGAILKILEDEGFLENTLVMFISNNGSSFPYSKSNAYLNSTKTPWIIRCPGICRDRAATASATDQQVTEEDIIVGGYLQNPLLCCLIAQLREDQSVYVSSDEAGTVRGAAQLTNWSAPVSLATQGCVPSDVTGLKDYCSAWHEQIGGIT
jgi:N-sulfoglucosamine sulfohydrolase